MRAHVSLASLAVALLVPATAGAASVSVDPGCHRAAAGAEVTVAGAGFAPQAEIEVRLAGSLIATGESDASGGARRGPGSRAAALGPAARRAHL
jgi:hypothetical protein